jgi:elongation factor Ts
MAEITAADVAKLRKLTGAGMMDCKKALSETNGDFDTAIENLRKKGQKVAAKREDREAKEGVALAGTSADMKNAAIVVLNSETDFVAKNADFVAVTKSILDVAIEKKPANLDELLGLEVNGLKVSEIVTEQMSKIGEKIELSYYEMITGETVAAYIHPGNKLATIVALNKPNIDGQVGRDVAMQIAAMSPVSVDKDDCPQKVIDSEIEIAKEQLRNEGKPEDMIEKIALGKLSKFFAENTLLNQEFVKESKTTVKQYLAKTDKDLTVTTFKRYAIG